MKKERLLGYDIGEKEDYSCFLYGHFEKNGKMVITREVLNSKLEDCLTDSDEYQKGHIKDLIFDLNSKINH